MLLNLAGRARHDDRKFLEAVHYFTVHSITWRALPRYYGKWNSLWKLFWLLSRSGVFEAFFQMLAECSQTAHLVQFFYSTTALAHVSAAGAKGGSSASLSAVRAVASQPKSTSRPISTQPSLLPSDRGETSYFFFFETSLYIGPDIRPRIALTDKAMTAKPT